MTAIINNFRVQERRCPQHGEVSRYISIESTTSSRMKIICHRCHSELNGQGNSRVISIEKFKEYLVAMVGVAENRITQQS
jgi:hypothetical protein